MLLLILLLVFLLFLLVLLMPAILGTRIRVALIVVRTARRPKILIPASRSSCLFAILACGCVVCILCGEWLFTIIKG